MKKLVIIPTYNERENVSRMISKVMSLFGGYDLLIVDDGSPDRTGRRAAGCDGFYHFHRLRGGA